MKDQDIKQFYKGWQIEYCSECKEFEITSEELLGNVMNAKTLKDSHKLIDEAIRYIKDSEEWRETK